MNKINDYASRILLFQNRWIPAREMAQAIGTTERGLRGADSPIRSVAISGDKGYKSITHATDEEFSHYCNRIRKHAIEELKRIQFLKKRRIAGRQETFNF